MKFCLATLILLSGVACTETSSSPMCDLQAGDSELAEILGSSAKCPDCLSNQIEKSLLSCPADPFLLRVAFYSSIRREKYEVALEYYEKLDSQAGAHASDHVEAGFLLQAVGDHGGAVRSFRRALPLAEPDAQFALAKSLHQIGGNGEAIQLLEALIERVKSRPEIVDGEVHVVGEESHLVPATLLLAECYVATRDVAKAKALLLALKGQYPADEQIQSEASRILPDEAVVP